MKKWFAMILTLVMVLTLSACGAKEGTPAVKEETPATEKGPQSEEINGRLKSSFPMALAVIRTSTPALMWRAFPRNWA